MQCAYFYFYFCSNFNYNIILTCISGRGVVRPVEVAALGRNLSAQPVKDVGRVLLRVAYGGDEKSLFLARMDARQLGLRHRANLGVVRDKSKAGARCAEHTPRGTRLQFSINETNNAAHQFRPSTECAREICTQKSRPEFSLAISSALVEVPFLLRSHAKIYRF